MFFSLTYCFNYCLICLLVIKNKKFVKESFCFFVKSFLILYFTVFIRVKQIVVKVYLKYPTSWRIEFLYPIFYHSYIYKITEFDLVAKSYKKWQKSLAVSLKASSSFLDQFLEAWRSNLISTRIILLPILVICSVPNKIFSITFLSSWIVKIFKP